MLAQKEICESCETRQYMCLVKWNLTHNKNIMCEKCAKTIFKDDVKFIGEILLKEEVDMYMFTKMGLEAEWDYQQEVQDMIMEDQVVEELRFAREELRY